MALVHWLLYIFAAGAALAFAYGLATLSDPDDSLEIVGGLFLLLLGVGCGVALVPAVHAALDADKRHSNERRLELAEQTLTECVNDLSKVLSLQEQNRNLDSTDVDRLSPADAAHLTWQQAKDVVCVLNAVERLSDLKCRTHDVAWPPPTRDISEERERWELAVDHYAIQSLQHKATSVAAVTEVRLPADETTWPLLARHRDDAWVVWPADGGPITHQLPTEQQFHEYCRLLADPAGTRPPWLAAEPVSSSPPWLASASDANSG